jgi:pimeloyl-ACP methyl ester carboxylesterase
MAGTGTDVHNDLRKGNFSHKIDLTANRLGSVNSERSMIGQLQRIRGAAVFTFDYQQFSARWVDDSHIGPALGAAIDCLYKATGERVIIVGHSMGGLAARYAVTHPGVGGIDRATEVNTVVTFGTPETGSLIALLADDGANTAAAAGLVNGDLILPLLRLFLAECGTLATSSLQTGTICDFLPGPARAFDSDAGRALRYGSAQLAALKPWPKAIVVDALAGQTTFQVPQAGWFALPWNTSPVPVGDMIVTVDSALKGTSVTKQVPCSYQLNAVRGAADSVGLTLALVNKNDVAQQPFAAFKGAYLHTDLMRDIELTNEATGEISVDIAAREATPPRAYSRYGNGRFGFSCDVPANFRSQRAPDNGDGFGYKSPDGRAQLICFGRNNLGFGKNNLGIVGNTAIGSTSARQEYEQQLASHRSQGDSITYQALVGDSITVSGISSNGEIYFERILWGHGSVDTMNWTYLRSLQRQLQDAVEHSANTFRPGDLDSPH